MKKKIICLGVFLLAFLVGYFVISFTNLIKPGLSETNSIIEQSIKINPPATQPETISKPKMFRVKKLENVLENQKANKHIIEPGAISTDVKFYLKRNESWLGLFGKNEALVLKQAKVKIRQPDKSDDYWRELTVKGKEKPLFLVKGLKNVKAGKVNTLFRGITLNEEDENNQTTEIEKGFFKEFKLGDRDYRLRVEDRVSEEQRAISVLILETDKESQIIDYVYSEGDWANLGSLYWVGDLDADGKLDLYKDFWDYEKGYYSSGLFLSSEAEKGKLVKMFEFFGHSGC